MKGRAVPAISNASQLRGLVVGGSSKRRLYRRHNWRVDGASEFGPMDMQFESGPHLISLNLDLTFGCTDAQRLQKSEEEARGRTRAPLDKPAEDLADDEDAQEILVPPPSEPIGNLGQFTIKGVGAQQTSEGGQQAQADKARPKEESSGFLPLIVLKHKGA